MLTASNVLVSATHPNSSNQAGISLHEYALAVVPIEAAATEANK
jgi:hypothetical protein